MPTANFRQIWARQHGSESSNFWRRHGRILVFSIFAAQILVLVLVYKKHNAVNTKSDDDMTEEVQGYFNPQESEKITGNGNSIQQPGSCCCPEGGGCILEDWVDRQVDYIIHSKEVAGKLPRGTVWYEKGDEQAITEENAGIKVRSQRLVEQGVKRDSSIPGVEDVYEQLKQYLIILIRQHFTRNESVAIQAQQHTKGEELGVYALDAMEDTKSIPLRVKLLNKLAKKANDNPASRVGIYTTSSVDLMGVRREILPWLQYHTELGIAHFYILYDGHDEEAVDAMNDIDHLTLFHIHPPFANNTELTRFNVWRKMHKQWGGRPGNFELMVKQGYGTREALGIARSKGIEWLMHIDPDEFFYPDNVAFDLVAEFANQPSYVSSVRFMNFEGLPEFGDVKNRYEQVTLFRAHKHFITPEAFALRNKCKLSDNRSFLVLYANGKSAVRVDAEGARQMGPHYFTGSSSDRWKTKDNPNGEWRDKISNTSFILHYAYSYQSDVTEKSHRSCPHEFVAAALAGDKDKVQSCFLIDFDRDAFLAAAEGKDEEFYYSRMVLSEGARLRCKRGDEEGWCIISDVEYFKALLTKTGLIRRVRDPQQILRSHERILEMMAESLNMDDYQKSKTVETEAGKPADGPDPILLGIEAPNEN